MILSSRAILLLLVSDLLMLLFSPIIHPLLGMLIFNCFWLIFVIWDYALTPVPGKSLSIKRIVPIILSNLKENKIRIEFENSSQYSLSSTIRDDSPCGFRKSIEEIKNILKPGAKTYADYNVKPEKRGNYKFGYLWVRIESLFGLIIRQYRLDIHSEVKVYPSIHNLKNFDLLINKSRLREIGIKPGKTYGIGTDFESLREYRPDDDCRRINWKATARKNTIIVEQFDTEKSQNILAAIDLSRATMQEIDGAPVIEHIINAALLLTQIALKNGDRVGLLGFGKDIRLHLPPEKGKKQMHMILESLKNIETLSEEPDYINLVRFLSVKNRKRTMIFLFTNLENPAISDIMFKTLRALYPRHLPVIIVFSDHKLLSEADTEPGDKKAIFRKAVLYDLLYERQKIIKNMRHCGLTVIDAYPGEISSVLLNRYLEMKVKGKL